MHTVKADDGLHPHAHATAHAPREGDQPVPGYRLVRLRGRGGFGEVWEAEAPGGILVALKFIPLSSQIRSAEYWALEVGRAVRHPNVLSNFGSWQSGDVLIVGMELADRSLADRLREASAQGLRGVPRGELLGYLTDVAAALDFLNAERHELGGKAGVGLMHRDLKPQNILLFGGGGKVADFGQSRLLIRGVSEGAGPCSLPYTAPEFFSGRGTRRSDQYSLGVTYCQLRGGRLPFVGTRARMKAGHMWERPDLGALPEPERPIVERALAKRPEERWPNCEAFLRALKALGSEEEASSPELLSGERSANDWDYRHPWTGASFAATATPADPNPHWQGDAAEEPPAGLFEIASAPSAERLGLSIPPRPSPVPSAEAPRADAVSDLPSDPSPIDATPAEALDSSLPVEEADAPPSPPEAAPPEESGLAPAGGATAEVASWKARLARAAVLLLVAGLAVATPERGTSSDGHRRERAATAGARRSSAPDAKPPTVPPSAPAPAPVPAAPAVVAPAQVAALPPLEPAEPPGPGGTTGPEATESEVNAASADPTADPEVETASVEVASAAPGVEREESPATPEPPAPEVAPASASDHYQRGRSHLSKAEYGPASAAFTEAIRIDAGHAWSYCYRAVASYLAGQPHKALADYTEAIRLMPSSAMIYGARGRIYYDLGERDKALADYTEAIRLQGDNAIAYAARARIYDDLGDYARALADCTEVIRLTPDDIAARYRRGLVRYHASDFAGAVDDFTEVIRLDAEYARAYQSRGDAYARLGDGPKAGADRDSAIRLASLPARPASARTALPLPSPPTAMPHERPTLKASPPWREKAAAGAIAAPTRGRL